MCDPLLIGILMEKSPIRQPSNHQDNAQGSTESPDQLVSKSHAVLARPLSTEVERLRLR